MDDATRKRLERERRRLVLAESDMRQTAGAADYLSNVRMNGDAERALWTGLVITYARPYTDGKLGAVRGRLAKPEDQDLRRLHTNLCARRDDLFAHNDETDLRDVVDVWALLDLGAGRYVEQHASMNLGVLPAIARLATAQGKRFRVRLNEIEEQLGRGRTSLGEE